jgi:RNA polymerase sigma factor (TIGR02999 family)
MDGPRDITGLLKSWGEGDRGALNELIPIVYPQLRRIAAYHARYEGDVVVEPTALVHEAYLRLVDQTRVNWNDRNHFYSVVARIIRHTLVDLARARRTAKRGSGSVTIRLHDSLVSVPERDLDLVALDECLEELGKLDPQQLQIVEMRFFGGLSTDETASALGVSPSTVKRNWSVARSWLFRELRSRPVRR